MIVENTDVPAALDVAGAASMDDLPADVSEDVQAHRDERETAVEGMEDRDESNRNEQPGRNASSNAAALRRSISVSASVSGA